MNILHKRTNKVDILPKADNLNYGEIAINYAKNSETISFKNDQDEVISFSYRKNITYNVSDGAPLEKPVNNCLHFDISKQILYLGDISTSSWYCIPMTKYNLNEEISVSDNTLIASSNDVNNNTITINGTVESNCLIINSNNITEEISVSDNTLIASSNDVNNNTITINGTVENNILNV